MRVALDVSAVPRRPAGAGVYILELVKALADTSAVELELVATRGDGARWRALAPGAHVHADVPANRPARLVWEQLRGPAAARRTHAAVWHGPHYTMPLRCPLPAVVTIHDTTFFDHPEWHERMKVRYFRRMIGASAARARQLVCVSEHTARRARSLIDVRTPITVIPHGVDHDRFRPAPAAAAEGGVADLALLARIGVHPPYLAFMATLEPRKNVPALVRAFDRIAARHRALTLVVAGQPGWGAREVDTAIAAATHRARIVRPGYVEAGTVPALFRQAVAVVYPSLEEGFGLPALEALACGAPLVTTSGSAMEEVAGGATVLVPPGDVDALAGALDGVVADDRLREDLRARGPGVAAPYTWRRCAERHAAVYEASVHDFGA